MQPKEPDRQKSIRSIETWLQINANDVLCLLEEWACQHASTLWSRITSMKEKNKNQFAGRFSKVSAQTVTSDRGHYFRFSQYHTFSSASGCKRKSHKNILWKNPTMLQDHCFIWDIDSSLLQLSAASLLGETLEANQMVRRYFPLFSVRSSNFRFWNG